MKTFQVAYVPVGVPTFHLESAGKLFEASAALLREYTDNVAGPEEMLAYLDIEPGAVSVMGLMNDKEKQVQLLIDEDVLEGEYIGCHPCVNTSSLKMKTADIIEKFLPATGHAYRVVHLVGED